MKMYTEKDGDAVRLLESGICRRGPPGLTIRHCRGRCCRRRQRRRWEQRGGDGLTVDEGGREALRAVRPPISPDSRHGKHFHL